MRGVGRVSPSGRVWGAFGGSVRPIAKKVRPASTYPPPPHTIHVTESAAPDRAVLTTSPLTFGALLDALKSAGACR